MNLNDRLTRLEADTLPADKPHPVVRVIGSEKECDSQIAEMQADGRITDETFVIARVIVDPVRVAGHPQTMQ